MHHTNLTLHVQSLPESSISQCSTPVCMVIQVQHTINIVMHTVRCCRFRPEAEHSANAGLHIARELLEPIKKKYPWISYSDLWTLAGCVAVEELGGQSIGSSTEYMSWSACACRD